MRTSTCRGPRMALAGPHIDGEHPAYPRIRSSRAIPKKRASPPSETSPRRNGAEDLFPAAVGERDRRDAACATRTTSPAPRTSRSSTPRDLLLAAGLDAIEHITSFGTSIVPVPSAPNSIGSGAARQRRAARRTIRAVRRCRSRTVRRRERLYGMLERQQPFVNPTLAVFEVRAGVPREGGHLDPSVDVRGFDAMKRLTLAAFRTERASRWAGTAACRLPERGEAPWREIELLAESGLTPLQALTAATSIGAASLRRDDLGVIAPGKLADMIVLDRDPSTDIHAIRSVSRVMVDGRWVDRSRYLRW